MRTSTINRVPLEVAKEARAKVKVKTEKAKERANVMALNLPVDHGLITGLADSVKTVGSAMIRRTQAEHRLAL